MTATISGTVAHVVENLDDTYGGPARSVPNLAARTRDHGWAVHLYSVEWSATERNDVIRRERLDWSPCRMRGPRKICFSPQLVRALQGLELSSRPIIHLHTLWNAVSIAAYRTARRRGIPLVISTRGALYPWSLSQGRARKALAWRVFVRAALEAAALVHVTEPSEAETVRELGVSAPLIVVPNGVEEVSGSALQARFDQPIAASGSGRRYLFLSRIHKKKGIDLLLESWARSVARQRGGRLEVVGPFATATYEQEIRTLAASLGIDGTVRFRGMLRGAERERAFMNADVFVLPSHTENFGIAIAEALARGLPVITTTGTPWRVIQDCGAGWWINLTRDELVQALDRVAMLPVDALHAMGRRAAVLARQFSWDHQTATLVSAYQWVLGGPLPATVQLDGRRAYA